MHAHVLKPLVSGRSRTRNQVRPALRIASFNLAGRRAHQGQVRSALDKDKSTSAILGDQDQSASLSSFAATARGVSIKVNPDGAYTSTEYPDGFRWTQTIVTNAKRGGGLLASPVTYVDPTPNDDSKPFYWTDAEHVSNSGDFRDTPSRNPRPAGTVNWDATLSLNGVKGKTAKRFDSLSYGFSVDSSGTVTANHPTSPASLGGHMAALRSAFPGWTFS